MLTLPPPADAPTIQTRSQFDRVVENIVQLQFEQNDLERAQAYEIALIRQKYRAPLAELERYLKLEMSWAETWARMNPQVFAGGRLLTCAGATLGFRVTPPRIERASRKWTWSRIGQTLGRLAWGRRYLRQPEPEVDKEALVADLGKLSPIELRSAGIKIVCGDRFFIEPHQPAETPSAPELTWQEAA